MICIKKHVPNGQKWRLPSVPSHLMCTVLFFIYFFGCTFYPSFYHFIICVASDLFPVCVGSLYRSLHSFLPFPCICLHLYNPPTPSQSRVSPAIYLVPTSLLTLPHPSLLHHSISVLAQLQKWELAVTNLLAEPPRAPCGGASSQRTHVIDWTEGKLCQAGHHDWISCLIINSLLPQVLLGDASVMWRIFMTHGALSYYG